MKKSDKCTLVLWGLLSLLALLFIYGQSLLPPKDSGDLSGFVMTILKPLMDPSNRFDPDAFHHFIRKTAHFTEFALFGAFFGNFCRKFEAFTNKKFGFLNLFVCLAVAVSDEFLQSFTGRGSSVRDVVLDFSGALFGLGIVYLIRRIFLKKGE